MTQSEELHAVAQPERLPVVADGLHDPTEVVSAPTGDVFVANSGANNVIRIPRAPGSGGDGQTQTLTDPTARSPYGIAIAANGNVVVVNTDSASVSVFSADGNFLRSITNPATFQFPRYVAISPITGDAFITGDTVVVPGVPPTPNAVMRIPASRLGGGRGNIDLITDASFNGSNGIVVSPTGDVFVANSGANSVTRISARRAFGWVDGEITVIGDAGKFYQPLGIAIGRNGDVLVTNITAPAQEGFVTRIPAARAYGKDNTVPLVPLDPITSSTLTSPHQGGNRIVVSPFTGDAYVTNFSTNTVVVIPATRAAGGSGIPVVVPNTDPLSGPEGIALSPVTGDLFVANSNAGTAVRIVKGIKVVGANGEGQFYTVPPAITAVILHTEGGSLDGGTGLNLKVVLAVTPGEQFYLINQYNAAYIFHRPRPVDDLPPYPWSPLLVSGGAGTGASVQTVGVARGGSNSNGNIYPGNGGTNYGSGGGGWGGGGGSGSYIDLYHNGEAGSGSKGGDSASNAKGGIGGADGANSGPYGDGAGGEGEVSLTMNATAVTFTVSGGNSHPVSGIQYDRGGAGYSAAGNSGVPGQSGAGSGYAANAIAGRVAASSAPANGNIPTAELVPV